MEHELRSPLHTSSFGARLESKESKPEASEKEPTRAFSLGAESLEEFFGLKKKPRMVSRRRWSYRGDRGRWKGEER